MGEDCKIGIEHLVGLRYGDLNTEPVAGVSERCRSDAVLVQPLVDLLDGLRSGRNKGINLAAPAISYSTNLGV